MLAAKNLKRDIIVVDCVGGSAMDVAEASLQGAGIENGAAAARRHQPIHGAHAKLGDIGQYRPPPNGDIHVHLPASLGLLLKRAPFSFQDRKSTRLNSSH